MDLTTGSLFIDGVDVSTIPRTTVRRLLTAVPQSALHLPGTLRQNLDPFSLQSDAEIISALEKVQLWTTLSTRGGLDAAHQPSSLSAGQNQLFALARALLQRSKIVILDEATSSIDADTDLIIKKVMQEAFVDCTVVTVAHRPETILACEVVVVLEGGKVVETGEPGVLMEKYGGFLRGLLGEGDL